jgi:hypothetical protein
MALIDDGDMIRGLGFVALYAAYLVEAVDECLKVISAYDAERNGRMCRWPTSQKIEHIQRQLRGIEPLTDELAELPCTLQATADLLEERNLVIHGRVYAVPNVGNVRISGRPGVPETPGSSAELYALANDLYSACSPLLHAATFSLHRQFTATQERNAGNATPSGGASLK